MLIVLVTQGDGSTPVWAAQSIFDPKLCRVRHRSSKGVRNDQITVLECFLVPFMRLCAGYPEITVGKQPAGWVTRIKMANQQSALPNSPKTALSCCLQALQRTHLQHMPPGHTDGALSAALTNVFMNKYNCWHNLADLTATAAHSWRLT